MPQRNSNETKSEPEFQQLPMQPSFIRAPDFKAIYTNFVQTGFTAFDISVMFSETAGITDSPKLVIEQKVRVSMTPSEAKVLLGMLATTIQNYEKQFGQITIPAGALQPAGKTEGT